MSQMLLGMQTDSGEANHSSQRAILAMKISSMSPILCDPYSSMHKHTHTHTLTSDVLVVSNSDTVVWYATTCLSPEGRRDHMISRQEHDQRRMCSIR